jgi:hypothetical protein
MTCGHPGNENAIERINNKPRINNNLASITNLWTAGALACDR